MKEKILMQYAQADFFKRMHLFLQFPDMRNIFQNIERKELAARLSSSFSIEKSNIKKIFLTRMAPQPNHCDMTIEQNK